MRQSKSLEGWHAISKCHRFASLEKEVTQETRIRLSDKDHERLRVAAAFAKKSMAEFVKSATLKHITAFEAEYTQRLAEYGEKPTQP